MEEMAIAMTCNNLSSAYDRLGASHAISYLISTSTVGSRYHPYLKMRESRFRKVTEPASHTIMKWWGQDLTNPVHLESVLIILHWCFEIISHMTDIWIKNILTLFSIVEQTNRILDSSYEPPRWLSGKKSVCQCQRCRRHRFNPWLGKIPWRRKWQPTAVFLLGGSYGQRSHMYRLQYMWLQRIGHDWAHTHAYAWTLPACIVLASRTRHWEIPCWPCAGFGERLTRWVIHSFIHSFMWAARGSPDWRRHCFWETHSFQIWATVLQSHKARTTTVIRISRNSGFTKGFGKCKFMGLPWW